MKVNYSRYDVEIRLSHAEYAALGIVLNEGIEFMEREGKDPERVILAKQIDKAMKKPEYVL